MKKTYVKPAIMLNSFELYLSVSVGCSFQATSAQMQCPVAMEEWGGATIFTDAVGCILTTPDMTDFVCYHVPMANANVFES